MLSTTRILHRSNNPKIAVDATMSTTQEVSKSLHKVAALNNKAAHEMAHSDFATAIATLAQALSVMHTRVPLFKKLFKEEERACREHQGNSRLPYFAFVSLLKSIPGGDSASTEGYLYKDAVRVVGFEQQQQQRREEGSSSLYYREVTEILSYAVFFNLGLCHQLVSEMNTTTDRAWSFKLLKRSIKFYNRAQTILNKRDPEEIRNLFGGHIMLGLSIMNNLGRAYCCLDQATTAKLCFQTLWDAIRNIYPLSSLRQVQQASHGRGNTTCRRGLSVLMGLEDYDSLVLINGFLTNIQISLFAYFQAAPAA